MHFGKWFHTSTLLVGLSFLLVGCASVSQTSTPATLDKLLSDPALQGATVSLMVRDARTGTTLYQHNPRTRLVPASNLKLLTTAAAMDVLGPHYRFATQLLSNGIRQGDRLTGNLYLRGLGDPSIQFADYQALAAQLASQGVRQVQGDLVFDDTWFDAERLGVDWSHDDETTYYGAQISALTVAPNADFDAGSVLVTAKAPLRNGSPVSVDIFPPTDYLQLSNRAMSGPGNSYGINRRHGTNLLQLSGAVAPGKQSQQLVSVWEPTQLVANLFEQALAQQGITVLGRRVMAVDSQTYLASTTPYGARYATWFGALDAARGAQVSTNFGAIRDAFDNKPVKIDCDCDEPYFAYVYPARPYTVWVCKAFWAAAVTGTDSRGGTLVHELSHFDVVAATDDVVYGQAGAAELARSAPERAIRNADSHEYFGENSPVQSVQPVGK